VNKLREELEGKGLINKRRLTFIDTPGHEVFQIMRGRATSMADIALVLVSVEDGAEIQTKEVLLQADRFKVPVMFVLSKIDMKYTNIELTRAELRRQCQVGCGYICDILSHR
jgi:translation initiation factor IF-2